MLLLQRRLLLDQPPAVRAFHVAERKAEQRACRRARLRVVVAQAERRAAGRRRRNVDVRVAGKCRMRVVIEQLDPLDLRQQPGVDRGGSGIDERT